MPDKSFTLSFAYAEETAAFDTPEAAGRAYAQADAALAPRVTELRGRAVRTLARTTPMAGQVSKGAPRVIDATQMPCATERAFWTGFNDAMFHKAAA